MIFLPVQIAAVRLPVLYPAQYQQAAFKLQGWQLWFCALVGVMMVIFFSVVILFDLKSLWKIGCFVAFILSGIGYYHRRKKYLETKGIQITKLLKKKATRNV